MQNKCPCTNLYFSVSININGNTHLPFLPQACLHTINDRLTDDCLKTQFTSGNIAARPYSLFVQLRKVRINAALQEPSVHLWDDSEHSAVLCCVEIWARVHAEI